MGTCAFMGKPMGMRGSNVKQRSWRTCNTGGIKVPARRMRIAWGLNSLSWASFVTVPKTVDQDSTYRRASRSVPPVS
jgi:hypothetical protein